MATQAIVYQEPPRWTYTLLNDDVKLEEDGRCTWSLRRAGQVVAVSTHPSPLLRKCYFEGWLTYRQTAEMASALGVALEYVIIQ